MKPVGGRGDLEGLAIAGDLGDLEVTHPLPPVQNQLVSCVHLATGVWDDCLWLRFAILACAPVTD